MKKIFALIFTIFLSFTLMSCNKATTKSTRHQTTTKQDMERKLIELNGKVELNQRYSSNLESSFIDKVKDFSSLISLSFLNEYDNGSNISLSPISILSCLSLVVECSNNETREEVLNALGFSYDELYSNIKGLLNKNNIIGYSEDTEEVTFEERLINSIWLDYNGNFKEKTLKTLHDNYLCEAYGVDFKNNPKDVSKIINEYIKEKTNGLINLDLDLSPMTLAILMNILYLKDSWLVDDDLKFTDEYYDFKNTDNTISNVKLLNSSYERGRVIEFDKAYVCHVFTRSGVELTFIVPKDEISVMEAMNNTLSDALNAKYIYDDGLKNKYFTRVLFPKFESESNNKITDLLKKDFKINMLFSPDCDLSNLTDDDAYISDIIHATKVKVDEKGIEGAAVTLAIVKATSDDYYNDIFDTFIIDKAFGFVISKYNVPLFSGIVNKVE